MTINKTRKIGMKALSTILALLMLFTSFSVYDIWSVMSKAAVSDLSNEMKSVGTTGSFYAEHIANAPELAILTPGGTTSQYFLTNNDSGTANSTASSTAEIKFVCAKATRIRIIGELFDENLNAVSANTNYIKSITFADNTTVSSQTPFSSISVVDIYSYSSSKTIKTITLNNVVTNTSYIIRWKFTYTCGGNDYVLYAYTGVYAPNLNVAGMITRDERVRDSYNTPEFTSMTYIAGAQKVGGGNYANNSSLSPLKGLYGSGQGSLTALEQSYFTSSVNGGVFIQTNDDFNDVCKKNDTDVKDNRAYKTETTALGNSWTTYGSYDSPTTTGSTTIYFDDATDGAVGSRITDSDYRTDTYSNLTTGVAYLLVDRSRFTNYNQIPNLKAGYINFHSERSNSWLEYIKSISNTATSDQPTGAITVDGVDDSNSSGYFNRGPYILNGTIASESGFNLIGSDHTQYASGVLYNNYLIVIHTIGLQTTVINKSSLRSSYYTYLNSGYNTSASNTTTVENSVKNIVKQLCSYTNSSVSDYDISSTITAAENNLKTTMVGTNTTLKSVYFYVPEAIYLTPTTGSSSSFQYVLDSNNVISGGKVTSTVNAGYRTVGTGTGTSYGDTTGITFYYDNAANVSITCSGATSITLSATTGTVSGTTITGTTTAQGRITAGTASYSAGTNNYLTWTATYYDTSDGIQKTATAYTAVYSPLIGASATLAHGLSSRNDQSSSSKCVQTAHTEWCVGLHSIRNGTNGQGTGDVTGGMKNPPLTDSNVWSYSIGRDDSLSNSRDLRWVSGATGYNGYWTEQSPDSGKPKYPSHIGYYEGLVYYDPSRVTNLNQVPGLKVGIDIHLNYTEDGHASLGCFEKGGTENKTNLVANTAVRVDSNSDNGGTRLGNVAMNFPVGSTEKVVDLCGYTYTKASWNYYIYATSHMYIYCEPVSKTDLRTAVADSMAENSTIQKCFYQVQGTNSSSTTYAYDKYVNLLEAAQKGLGQVGGFSVTANGTSYTNPGALATALNTARANALNNGTTSTSGGRQGSLTATQYNVILNPNNTVYSSETNTASYVSYDTILFTKNEYKGTTYNGMNHVNSAQSFTAGSSVTPSYKTGSLSSTSMDKGGATQFNSTTGELMFTHALIKGDGTSATSLGSNNGYYTVYYYTLDQFNVAYNVNGGTGTFANQTATYNTALTIRGASSRTGYTFKGWSDGTTVYTAGSTIPVNDIDGWYDRVGKNGTITLTAVWEPYYALIEFDGNYSTSGYIAPQKIYYDGGSSQTLVANVFSKNGYSFAGWKGYEEIVNDATERSYDNTSGTSYNDFIAFNNLAGPYYKDEEYILECDVKGSGTLNSFFYGPYDSTLGTWAYRWVASTVNNYGVTTTSSDGNNTIPLTSSYTHYRITFTLGNNTANPTGQTNSVKHLIFRAQPGCSASVKNITLKRCIGTINTSTETASSKTFADCEVVNQSNIPCLARKASGKITMVAQWAEAMVSFDVNHNSIRTNLFAPPGTVSSGAGGLTYSYDSTTGIITIDGTQTGGSGDIILAPFKPEAGVDYKITAEVVGGSKTAGDGCLALDYTQKPGADLNPTRKNMDFFSGTVSTSTSPASKTINVDSYLADKTELLRLWIWQNTTANVFDNFQIRIKVEKANSKTDFSPCRQMISGSAYGSLPTPLDYHGYTFDGWYTAASGGTKITEDSAYTSTTSHTLYAHWTKDSFSIQYNENKPSTAVSSTNVASMPSTNPQPLSYDTASSISSATPTLTGYTFAGWATSASGDVVYSPNAELNVSAVNSIYGTVGKAGTYNLYAKWTPRTDTQYKIEVYVMGTTGTYPTTATATYTTSGTTDAATITISTSNFATYAKISGTGITDSNISQFSLDTGASGSKLSGTINNDGSTVLKVYAKRASHTLTLDATNNGGTVTTTSKTLYYGQTYTLPTATKINYTHAGWDRTSSETTTFDYTTNGTYTMGTANDTLYAIFSRTFTVNFYDYSHQTTPTKETVTIYNNAASGTVTSPTIASQTVDGVTYNARGWSTTNGADASLAYYSGGTVTVTADATYYASYAASITATFYYNNTTGTSLGQSSATANATRYMAYEGSFVYTNYTIPSAVTGSRGGVMADYVGVCKDTNSTTTMTPTSQYTAYYAVYTKAVTFYSASGIKTDSTRRVLSNGTAYSCTLNPAVNPSNFKGSAFKHWSNSSTSYADSTKVTPTSCADTTFYAVYSKAVSIVYDKNSGTTAPASTTGTAYFVSTTSSYNKYNYELTITSSVPTWAGHTFLGWNTDKNAASGSSTYAAGQKISFDNNNTSTTLYAIWTTYKLNVYAYSNTAKNATETNGYTNSDVGGTVSITSNSSTMDTIQGSGTAHAYVNVTSGNTASITATAKPSAGYEFDGWFTTENLTGTPSSTSATITTSAMTSAGMTYYAKFSIQKYTVTIAASHDTATHGTFVSGTTGGTITNNVDTTKSSIDIYYGQKITLTAANNTGYTFKGWYPALNSGTQESASATYEKTVTAATTLYARFEAKSSAVTAGVYSQNLDGTFTNNANAGKISTFSGYSSIITNTDALKSGNWYFNNNVSIVTTCTDNGYSFSKWTSASNPVSSSAALSYTGITVSGMTISGTKQIDGLQTFNAMYVRNTYTITFNLNDSTQSNGSTAAVGGSINGFYTSAGTRVTTAQTLESKTMVYGSTATIVPPTRVGYVFTGWEIVSGGAGTITNAAAPATGNATFVVGAANTTLKAKWTAITYTVSFELNNGSPTGRDPVTATFDKILTVADSPKPAGDAGASWRFVGWSLRGDNADYTKAYFGMYTDAVTTPIRSSTIYFKSTFETQVYTINLTSTPGATVILYANWEKPVQIKYYYLVSGQGKATTPITDTFNLQTVGETERTVSLPASLNGVPTSVTMPNGTALQLAGWKLDDATASTTGLIQGNTFNITLTDDLVETHIVYAVYEGKSKINFYSNINGSDSTPPYGPLFGISESDLVVNANTNASTATPISSNPAVRTWLEDEPTREGYDFLGWSESGGDKNTVQYLNSSSSTLNVAYNTNLYAVWVENNADSALAKYQSVSITYGWNGSSNTALVQTLSSAYGADYTAYSNAGTAYTSAKTSYNAAKNSKTLTAEITNSYHDAIDALLAATSVLDNKDVTNYSKSFTANGTAGCNVENMNLNHYAIGTLNTVKTNYVNAKNVSTDNTFKLGATMKDQGGNDVLKITRMNDYVVEISKGYATTAQVISEPDFSIYETSSALQTAKTNGIYSGDLVGVNNVVESTSSKIYYLYTNVKNPHVVVSVDELTDNGQRVCYPTTVTEVSDTTNSAEIQKKTATNTTLDTYINEGMGTAVDGGLQGNYYKQKDVVTLSPSFEDSEGTAKTISYKFTAHDDSLNSTMARSATLKSGNDIAEKNAVNTDNNEITIIISYKAADGFGVTYDQWSNGMDIDFWLKQFRLYRTSGGAMNWEIPGWDTESRNDKSFAKPINCYKIVDGVYGDANYCSFTYTFTKNMISGFNPCSALDSRVYAPGYNQSSIQSYENAINDANLTLVHDYISAMFESKDFAQEANKTENLLHSYNSKYTVNVNGVNQERTGTGTGFIMWPGSKSWSLNYYPASRAYTYVHLIDRWGNVYDRIIPCPNIDNIASGASVTSSVIFEDGGSGLENVTLSSGFEIIPDENSTLDGNVYSSADNTIMLCTGEANKSYTVTMTDKAGNTSTGTLKTDENGNIDLKVVDEEYSNGVYTFTLGDYTVNLYEAKSNGNVVSVEYTPALGNVNTYKVKVTGRASMIQFIELGSGDGTGTRSYDRHNKKVQSITSYNENGEEIAGTGLGLAYEIWTVTIQLGAGLTGVRIKASGSSVWEDKSFAYRFDNQHTKADSELISVSLERYSGAVGAVNFTAVTGADVVAIQFKKEDGDTNTYVAEKAEKNKNGTLTFTGRVWFNTTGEQIATVRILDTYGWHDATTVTYTAK